MISPKLEELIWNGQARYESRAFAIQTYNLLPVPDNEFLIITGYDFQPAQIVLDTANAQDAYQGLHRIEILSGGNYNSYFHKMSGNSVFTSQNATAEQRVSEKPFHSVRELYMVCKKDIGICLSVMPDITALNPAPFDQSLTRNLFNQQSTLLNDFQQYLGFPNGVSSLNNSPYSQAYGSGPVNNLDGTFFSFRDNATIHRYKRFPSDLYAKDEMNLWTLVVHFVRVFNNPDNIA